jgi:DNA-3-methyladenine glycosylase
MDGQKGHAYVYFIYGLYYCFNVTAGNVPGKPEAVLIRALEPVAGEEIMAKRRGRQVKASNLTNGPSKLCMAMDISKTQNRTDLTAPPLFIEDASVVPENNIVDTTRIGIDNSGEWKNKRWRFYIRKNKFVSVK